MGRGEYELPDDWDDDRIEVHMYVHILFSTAGQKDVLREDDLVRLYAAITDNLKEIDAEVVVIGGTTNHIHILTSFSPDWPLQAVIDRSRIDSAKWVRANLPGLADFNWQESSGSFTISPEDLGVAETFIRDQEAYHEIVSYKDEFASLLRENGLDFDEDEILE